MAGPQILAFNIDTLNLRIGGWKTSFPLKTRRQGRWVAVAARCCKSVWAALWSLPWWHGRSQSVARWPRQARTGAPCQPVLLAAQRLNSWKREKGDPFFSFFWMSDDFIAARGRSGGIAVWARTTPQWELEKGVV